jgi:Flp pilus assembly pilin Flp
MKINSTMEQLWHDESGQAITEYGAILGFVAVLIAAVLAVGSTGSWYIPNSNLKVTTLGEMIYRCGYWLGRQLNNVSSAAS